MFKCNPSLLRRNLMKQLTLTESTAEEKQHKGSQSLTLDWMRSQPFQRCVLPPPKRNSASTMLQRLKVINFLQLFGIWERSGSEARGVELSEAERSEGKQDPGGAGMGGEDTLKAKGGERWEAVNEGKNPTTYEISALRLMREINYIWDKSEYRVPFLPFKESTNGVRCSYGACGLPSMQI